MGPSKWASTWIPNWEFYRWHHFLRQLVPLIGFKTDADWISFQPIRSRVHHQFENQPYIIFVLPSVKHYWILLVEIALPSSFSRLAEYFLNPLVLPSQFKHFKAYVEQISHSGRWWYMTQFNETKIPRQPMGMDSHINLDKRPKHGASINYSKRTARKFNLKVILKKTKTSKLLLFTNNLRYENQRFLFR